VGKRVRIVVCGFGRVGRSFAGLLADKRALVERTHGLTLDLVGVGELAGSLLAPGGLPPAETAALYETQHSFAGHADVPRASTLGRDHPAAADQEVQRHAARLA